MKPTLAFALLMSFGASTAAMAADAHSGGHAEHAMAAEGSSATAADSDAFTDGEIKKVDKSAGKITIKHAPLKNLDMPAMTMIFRVKDKATLEQVKAGDKVRFVAEKIDGKFTVTQLETIQ